MSMTLRDLVARGTPLDWFESVAIVQELCADVLARAGADGPRVPDLPGAQVKEDGTVVVVDPGTGDQAPVFRLGHVLNALLATGTPPVQLRLLVLTALAPESTYTTLLELSQALEYFERPDRRLVVRGVYARAQQLPPVESDIAPLPEKPLEPEKAKKVVQAAAFRWRRPQVVVAASLLLAAVVVAGGWLWASRPANAKLITDTRKTMARAVTSAVDAVKGRLGGKADPGAVEPAPPVTEAKARIAAKLRPARQQARRPLRVARSLSRSAMPSPVLLAPDADEASFLRELQKYDEVVYLNLQSSRVPANGVDRNAYSAADSNVRPPVVVRPMLPTEPPLGIPLAELTKFEVLVSAAGEVESAKIVAGPRTALDGMMLSAVKNWKFQPATKDGQPVAYRQQVWLTTGSR